MLAAVLLVVVQVTAPPVAAPSDWPSWRGPQQTGVATSGDYPTTWNVTEDDGVVWSVDLPGRGASTPVLATIGGTTQLVLTASIDTDDGPSEGVISYGLDGAERWRAATGPLVPGKHKKGSGANPSVVVGREHLFAYFKSGRLAAIDADGQTAWTLDLARTYGGYDDEALWWDLGTSPVVTEDAVVVAVMQSGPSFLVALDQATGEELWRTDRDTGAPVEAAQSYTTPVLGRFAGTEAIFTAGADAVTAHAADTGNELWRIGGLNPDGDQYFRSIASPVRLRLDDTADLLLVPYARGESVWAFRVPTDDGPAPTEAAWVRNDLGSDVPTPTGRGGVAFVLADKGPGRGVVTAIAIDDGRTLGTLRLPRGRDGYSASPVLAGDRLYLTREDGTTFVVDVADPAAMALAGTGRLDEFIVATPVLADGRVYLRTPTRLVAIGK